MLADGFHSGAGQAAKGTMMLFAGNCRGGFARPAVFSTGGSRYQMLF